MRKNTNVAREAAIANGFKKYSSGIPCRNGHLSDRYVSTNECLDCLKGSVIRMRKSEAIRRCMDKKLALEPKYRAKIQARYRNRYPLKTRTTRLFLTALRHAKDDGVELDFDMSAIEELLQQALDNGSVVVEACLPGTASLDKIDITKPTSLSNIQIVPHWYNRSKNFWNESDFIAAMAAYGFVRVTSSVAREAVVMEEAS
jgi:hypothetical protein